MAGEKEARVPPLVFDMTKFYSCFHGYNSWSFFQKSDMGRSLHSAFDRGSVDTAAIKPHRCVVFFRSASLFATRPQQQEETNYGQGEIQAMSVRLVGDRKHV